MDKSLGFERVQKKLKANERKPQTYLANEDFILSGKFFCGKCQKMMIGESGASKSGKIYRYYKCGNAKHGYTCDLPPIRKEVIEDYVAFCAVKFLYNDFNVSKLTERIHSYQLSTSPTRAELQSNIKDCSRKMENLMKAIEEGLDPIEIKDRYNGLKQKRDELENTLSEEMLLHPIMDTEDIERFLKAYRNIDLRSDFEKKMLIDLLVNSVVVNDEGTIDVYFNYRENEPILKVPDACSTTDLSWSTNE